MVYLKELNKKTVISQIQQSKIHLVHTQMKLNSLNRNDC